MKNKMPKFLKSELSKRFSDVDKFPDEIKTFMVAYASYYEWGLETNLTKIIRAMKRGITHLPKCQYNHCGRSTYFNCDLAITVGCCRDHSMKLNNLKKYGVENVNQVAKFKEKLKRTNLDRYGVESVFSSNTIKEKIKKTNIQKYGCESSLNNDTIRDKIKKTNLEKYGAENVFSSPEIKEKIKNTHLANLGVEYPMQSKEVQAKSKETCLVKYGCEYANQSDEVKDKIKDTMISTYGAENAMHVKSIKEKLFETNINRYGGKSPFSNNDVKDKIKKTNLNRLGVEYPMQSNDVKEKMKVTFKSNFIENWGVSNPMHVPSILHKSLSSMYRKKDFVWQTGEVSIVQGNEPIVLKELEEKGYSYHEVKTSPIDMPIIMYEFEDETHRYYPDIFIPKENTIIEVKSDYTLEKELDKNLAKFSAVKELGFDFRLEVR